ncbi:hypothetical protein ABH917_003078 [Thermobifida halotolerans]
MGRRAGRVSPGTLVLDSQAFSLLLRADANLAAYVDDARNRDISVATNSMTIIEARGTQPSVRYRPP